MWVLAKSTVAGDLGVTPIIQCLASMLITSTLVHTDLHNKAIPPLPFVYPHVEHLPDPRLLFFKIFGRWRSKKSDPAATLDIDNEKSQAAQIRGSTSGFKYYYWMLVRFIFEGTEMNMLAARPGVRNWFLRVLWTAAQGALIGIVFGFPCWCLAMVILGPIYGTENMGNKWAPQAIKAVYGAIVGWITNPVIAALALGSQAEHHLLLVAKDEEAGEARTADAESTANPITTIPEEGEAPGSTGPPSPFLRPFRAATAGSLLTPTDSPKRSRSNTVNSTRSRSGSISYQPSVGLTPQRSRSGSVSVRPPLTANASFMEKISPPPALGRTGRERGLTVSSYMSSTSSSFSYALGGTGGRAKRQRSNTAVSTSGIPTGALSSASTGRPVSAHLATPARGAQSPPAESPMPLTQPTFRRERTHSDVAGGAHHQGIVASGCDDEIVPIEHSATQRPGFDVFGQTQSTGVPVLAIQRPSMEATRDSIDQRRRVDSFERPMDKLKE